MTAEFDMLFQRSDKRARPGKSHFYRGDALANRGADVNDDGDVLPDEATPTVCGMSRSFGPFRLVPADEIDRAANEGNLCAVCAKRALELRDDDNLLTGGNSK